MSVFTSCLTGAGAAKNRLSLRVKKEEFNLSQEDEQISSNQKSLLSYMNWYGKDNVVKQFLF